MAGRTKTNEAELPSHLEHILNSMGIRVVEQTKQRDTRHEYKFRMPIFDENGEPDF